MFNASCGRISLYSWRNRSSVRCCSRRFPAGGWAVSCFSVRCIRSCLPFCSGCPAAMRSGTMPNLIHHTASRDNPAKAREANGAPLSVRMACGIPYSRKAASKIACTLRSPLVAVHLYRRLFVSFAKILVRRQPAKITENVPSLCLRSKGAPPARVFYTG
jgi:hypothetical protein